MVSRSTIDLERKGNLLTDKQNKKYIFIHSLPVRSSSNVNIDVAALVVETDGAHAEPSESGVDVLKHKTQSNISISFEGNCTVYYFNSKE